MGQVARRRLKKTGIAGLIVVCLLAFGFIFVPWLLRAGQPPKQPVAFPHDTHVRQAGIECIFCHRTATRGAAAGVPALEQCMFCHASVAKNKPEVVKIRLAYQEGRPIGWQRVYRLPDSVHFVHDSHFRAGLDCKACHGDVGSMPVVRPARSLEMGDCLGCHRDTTGPTECSFCHY
ncbi:MAG: molecular chaperone [Chloroflexi bacterium]|nr:molecular chaperone [Chloroflexota bacterium]